MSLIDSIKVARTALEGAELRLQGASNDDIDIAIFELNAAKLRYNRLLRMAKKEGVSAERFEIVGFAKR